MVFSKAVKGLSGSIHNFTAYKEKGLSHNPILYHHDTYDAETTESDDINIHDIQPDTPDDDTYYNKIYCRRPSTLLRNRYYCNQKITVANTGTAVVIVICTSVHFHDRNSQTPVHVWYALTDYALIVV